MKKFFRWVGIFFILGFVGCVAMVILTPSSRMPEQKITTKKQIAKKTKATTQKITKSTLEKEWLRAGGHIWSGVKLYYGPNKMYVGEILGGNERYTDPFTGRRFRGLKLKMKSGHIEWKDRNAIISGDWYIRSNDPAVKREEWHIFDE